MQMKGFWASMGLGLAVGALGAMMLPKTSEAYKVAKNAADSIKAGAEKAVDSMTSSM